MKKFIVETQDTRKVVLIQKSVYVQGHPMQTVFFETALKDRNMQVRFDLMSVLEC